jgi:serine/threonine-protein kinase
MGAVFAATDASGAAVAVKVVSPIVASRIDLLRRFYGEATVAGSVPTAGVVRVLDFASDALAGPFMVMELLRGESLTRRLQRGRLAAEPASAIVLSVLDTLAAVHAHGIIHRDLKPDNVFLAVTDRGEQQPTVLDFGVSRFPSRDRITEPGSVIGTPRFMAPEQAAGHLDIDARVDVYSAGAVLYACLTGFAPYRGIPREDVLTHLLRAAPEPLTGLRPDLPATIVAVVEHAMARDPAARFPTASAMATALRH